MPRAASNSFHSMDLLWLLGVVARLRIDVRLRSQESSVLAGTVWAISIISVVDIDGVLGK